MLFTLDWATIDGADDTPKTTITRNNFDQSFEKKVFSVTKEKIKKYLKIQSIAKIRDVFCSLFLEGRRLF